MEGRDDKLGDEGGFKEAGSENVFSEFAGFLWAHKLWWLAPIILVFLILAALFLLVSVAPATAPFIYTLF